MSPSSDVVRLQLDRVLASTVFASAGRMSRFLRFVVERTLAGEGDRLKEYVIGIEVFDRDADYDPRLDSIVRVEAARLRSKLAEYYAGEGRNDAVVLTLPKGGYAAIIKVEAPQAATNGAAANGAATNGAAANGAATNGAAANGATSQAAPAGRLEHVPAPSLRSRRRWMLGAVAAAGVVAAAALAWMPGSAPVPVPAVRIAVMPFVADGADADAAALAQRVTEGVTAELVRDGRFNVVASSAARAEYSVGRRPRDVAAALGADIVVEARLSIAGDVIRVEARAARGETEEKLWVGGFSGDSANPDTLEREIAADLVQAVSSGKFR